MSFGFGIGDIILACNTIYDYAKKYKDAPKEFDEIAEKAKATAVILERIDLEISKPGNIVTRSGGQAELQLKANLKHLTKDCAELKDLTKRYDKIHDEGYGRRMLWAFKEANGLTDIRRRIGYHEQTLQIWYMTIFCESLRRIEGTSEKTLEAINLVKQMTADQYDQIKRALARGDLRPLREALKDSGICSKPTPRPTNTPRPPTGPARYRPSASKISDPVYTRPPRPRPDDLSDYEAFHKLQETQQEPRRNAVVEDEEFNSTLKAMRDYIAADPVAQTDMESRLRTSMATEARFSGPSYLSPYDTPRSSKDQDKYDEPVLIRRRSTGGQRSPPSHRYPNTEQRTRDPNHRRSHSNRAEINIENNNNDNNPRRSSPSNQIPPRTTNESNNTPRFLRVPIPSRPRRSSDTPPHAIHVSNSYESVDHDDNYHDHITRDVSRDRSRPGPAETEFYRVIRGHEDDRRRRSPSSRGSRSGERSESRSVSRSASTRSFERRRSGERSRDDGGHDDR